MLFLVFLIITEVLTLIVLKENLRSRSKAIFIISLIIHGILSLWLWRLLIETTTYKSFFDNPRHISMLMDLTGTICAVLVPRAILILFHFTGKLIRIKRGRHIGWLTNTGLTTAILIFSIIFFGTLYGRFNFKTENVEIKIKSLNKDLDGLTIVQLSDFHLASFYGHSKLLQKVMDKVNTLKPDLILNTGDFVCYGWREFDCNDTILSKAKSRYGNYAVMGNHDFGTYHPFFTEADRSNNVLILNNLIRSSGYTILNDTNTTVRIGEAKIGLIGIITKGRHPDILHGDLNKALSGLDSVDLKILLSHDPNQWEQDVVSKTDINITLSGHTHGMQMGIYTKWFKWSPSKYYYPHWSGLFIEGNQVQYVNRGLGVLAIPFRISMPPEITLITLHQK
jgi:hypothetical protein